MSARVGPAGGQLTTSAADGTRFTLTVPADALIAETTLTMTPIGAIEGFPGDAGVAAGVDLRPEGLVFFEPATLSKKPAAAGELTGFAYRGDGEGLQLYPTSEGETPVSLRLTSFSGYGLSGLTRAEIRDFPVPSEPGAAARQQMVLLLRGDGELTKQSAALLLMVWYLDGLRPLLARAGVHPGSGDADYLAAELEYLQWTDAVFILGGAFAFEGPPHLEDLLASELLEARSDLAAALRRGFQAHNDACLAGTAADAALGSATEPRASPSPPNG